MSASKIYKLSILNYLIDYFSLINLVLTITKKNLSKPDIIINSRFILPLTIVDIFFFFSQNANRLKQLSTSIKECSSNDTSNLGKKQIYDVCIYRLFFIDFGSSFLYE